MRGCCNKLLEAIEYEEHLLVLKGGAEAVEQGLADGFGHTEGLRNGGERQIRVANWGKWHEVGAISEVTV